MPALPHKKFFYPSCVYRRNIWLTFLTTEKIPRKSDALESNCIFTSPLSFVLEVSPVCVPKVLRHKRALRHSTT